MRDDRHTHGVHTWPLLMGLALCPLSCQTLTHKEAGIQAEQRWNTVRGRVKTQLAKQQYEGRLFEEAAATLIESLSLDPKQPDAYVLLARANLELGRIASAREVVDMAHRAELDSPELVYTEGVILEQCEDLDGALEQYRRAWALDPKNVDYLVALVESLVAVGRSSQALALLMSNTDRLDDDGTLRVLSASIATLNNDVDLAIHQLSRAMTSPDAADAIADKLGVLLARSARCDEALAILRPILRHAGDVEIRGTVRRAVAACYLDTGAIEQAKQTLLAYTFEHPEDVAAQLLLAKAAIGTGDITTALTTIGAAEARKPNHPEVKLVRAVIQWRTDDLDAASSTLREILTLVPDDVDAHCLLGEISLAQSQPGKAYAEFQRALEIDPACRWAAAGLKSLEGAATGS